MPSSCSSLCASGVICRNEERNILRRWPKVAAVTRSSIATLHSGCEVAFGTSSTREESTLGRGVKGEQDAREGAPLAEHGEPPIVAGAGLCHDAERDLALKHQHQAVEPGRPRLSLEPANEEGGRDTIGQVGDDACRWLQVEGAIIDLTRVGGDNLEPPRIGFCDV